VYVFLDVLFLCRLVSEPQRDMGAQASPSRMRSSDPKVVVDSLADDAWTATPPPAVGERRTTPPLVADSGTGSPLRAGDVGARGAIGDVETRASPHIIDVDPISTRPAGATTTWSRTRIRLARRREVRGHPTHKYLTPL
jgi:hypothetical protein